MTAELHRYGNGASSTRVVVSRAKIEGAVKAIKAARRADRWDVWKRECNRLVVADLMTQQAAARLLQVAQGTSIWEDHYGRQVHSMLAPFLGEPEGEDDVDIDVVDDTPIAPAKPRLVETVGPTKPSWSTPQLDEPGPDAFREVMKEIYHSGARILLDGGPIETIPLVVELEHQNTEHQPEITAPASPTTQSGQRPSGGQSSRRPKKETRQGPPRLRGRTENKILDLFVEALAREGITPHRRLIVNGKMQYCGTVGKAKTNKSGRYKLTLYCLADGSYWAWGGYQNWRVSDGWVRWQPDNQETNLTKAERAEAKAWREELQRQEEEEERLARAAARRKAQWVKGEGSTQLTDDHAYLVEKAVLGHGLRAYKGMIVVPLVDNEGVLHTVQLIRPDGSKLFLKGGRKEGCFHILGEINDDTVVIIIAEGFATGATVHDVTELPVVLAIDAGNLSAVATAIRSRHPHAMIIIAGDDDWKATKPDGTPYNKGRIKAIEAASAVGGVAVFPTFGPGREDGQKDLNDMASAAGNAAVKAVFDEVLRGSENPGVPGVPGVPSNEINGLGRNTIGTPGVPEDEGQLTEVVISAAVRPCFRVFDHWTLVKLDNEDPGEKCKPGVWFFDLKAKGDGGKLVGEKRRVCSPVHIMAQAFDERTDKAGDSFGRVLRFRNSLGRLGTFTMPMSLLGGDGTELRSLLLSKGVLISRRCRRGIYLPRIYSTKSPKSRFAAPYRSGGTVTHRTFLISLSCRVEPLVKAARLWCFRPSTPGKATLRHPAPSTSGKSTSHTSPLAIRCWCLLSALVLPDVCYSNATPRTLASITAGSRHKARQPYSTPPHHFGEIQSSLNDRGIPRPMGWRRQRPTQTTACSLSTRLASVRHTTSVRLSMRSATASASSARRGLEAVDQSSPGVRLRSPAGR
jgi:phage/plasmid primase-like uncharacterized protein